MVRAFDGSDVDGDVLAALCDDALRAPTAGNARGVEAVVLQGSRGVGRYLAAATDATWRATSRRADGFARAGGAVVVLCNPAAYGARYEEPDKAASGLGDPGAWPVPYWHGDAGAFTMALLLLAEEQGLAACFLGAFRNASDVLDEVRAPSGRLLYGAVLLGGADDVQLASPSVQRPGPSRAERVLRERFPTG
jgi:nitroreductase